MSPPREVSRFPHNDVTIGKPWAHNVEQYLTLNVFKFLSTGSTDIPTVLGTDCHYSPLFHRGFTDDFINFVCRGKNHDKQSRKVIYCRITLVVCFTNSSSCDSSLNIFASVNLKIKISWKERGTPTNLILFTIIKTGFAIAWKVKNS